MNLKYLLACSVICTASASMNAAETQDLGDLQSDVVYEYNAMVAVQGVYTATETGLIRCYSSGSDIAPYEDAAHENPMEALKSYYGASGEKVRMYQVEAGQILYFYNSFPLDGGTFRITVGNEPVELSNTFPKVDDTPMSLSSNYSASLVFNIPVKCSKCILSVNEVSAEITPTISDSSISINWFNTLRQWYREGKINAGDVLTLTLTGVRDANNASNRPDLGDGLGKVVLKYTMAAKPLELVWESGTPTGGVADFMTYYLPGSEEGIVSLVFSGDLDPNCHPVAELTYGDRDNIDAGMYFENPPVSVDGKTVSVNLQGVTRFPEEMIPGLPAQKYIDLKITGIKGADGQYVLTGYASSPYSFGFSYNLKSVVYSLAADWIPAAGSVLNSGEEMEIWVLNGQKIIFDSVDFSYVKDGEAAKISVPYSDLRVSEDSAEAMLYNLTAPVINADPESEINVTFGGLMCADGLDHGSDIFVRYKSASSGVDAIHISESDNVFYDLTGRRVAVPSKGIYIQNGRKVIVK